MSADSSLPGRERLLTEAAYDDLRTQRYDAVVIGSGAGGLATASLLAQAGEKVLLLERHTTFGGSTHEFLRHDVEFDTGLHYVGAQIWKTDGSSFARRLADHVTGKSVEWARMDEVYDVVVVEGERFDVRSGVANQIADLKARFPEDGLALERYWKDVENTSATYIKYISDAVATGYIAKPVISFFSDPNFGSETVDEAFDRLEINNPKLRKLLGYLHGDYGVTPDKASWIQHAIAVAHYCDGAAYPVGGSKRIAEAVLRLVESHPGCKAYCGADVERLIFNEDFSAVVGVQLRGREGHITCGKVMCAAGAYHAFVGLIPEGSPSLVKNQTLAKARAQLRSVSVVEGSFSTTGHQIGAKEREEEEEDDDDDDDGSPPVKSNNNRRAADSLRMSPAHAMTFVALKGTRESLGLPAANWWIEDDEDFESVLISFPSAKDPSWASRHPTTSVCEVVVEARYEIFEKWLGAPIKQRGSHYDSLKEAFAKRMLAVLFRHFPQLKDKVEFYDASTPISAEHYLGSFKGSAYGLACTPARFKARLDWLSPVVMNGLYLTGQDVLNCGAVGAMMGAVVAASASSFQALWMMRSIVLQPSLYDPRQFTT